VSSVLHPVRANDGGEWVNREPYRTRGEDELLSLSRGESLNVNLDGVFLPFEALGDGTFRAIPRRGVGAYLLAGRPSALRMCRESDEPTA
jgi:hypothetical protein